MVQGGVQPRHLFSSRQAGGCDMKELVSQTELKTLLEYNPNTGIFIWLKKVGRCSAGTKAGRKNKGGYDHIQINKTDYLSHRLAWLYVYGVWPKDQLDHINGIRVDNRICNLREASNAENGQNRRAYTTNTSGHVGVSFDKKGNKWRAFITINYKMINLGFFKSIEEAINTRKAAEKTMHTFANQLGKTMNNELSSWYKVTFNTGIFSPSDRLVDVTPVEHIGEAGYTVKHREDDVPEWIKAKVGLLRLVDVGVHIGGVGKRHDKNIFYVKEGE